LVIIAVQFAIGFGLSRAWASPPAPSRGATSPQLDRAALDDIALVEKAYVDVPADQAKLSPPHTLGERLIQLGAFDQAGRSVYAHIDLTKLPPDEQKAAHSAIWGVIYRHDRQIQSEFRSLMPAHGWITSAKDGKPVALAAFLIVQHANNDLGLMKEVLERMEWQKRRGQVDGGFYALLYDRIAMQEGRLQRYGTQMVCVAHRYAPYRLEDAGHVDDRRRALGMKQSLEEYLLMFRDDPPCVG
jgi:hypothetical protein